MPERHQEHAERHNRVHEQLEAQRASQLEELAHGQSHERDDSAQRAEAAREAIQGPKQVEHQPDHKESEPQHHDTAEAEPTDEGPRISLPMLNPRLNYAHTMKTLRHQLTPAGRRFSKVIHTPIVEKTSEVLETTVARPSVLLGATWTALIVGSVFYFVSRHYGYMLSGSELLFSFIVGALIGLVIEGLMFMFKRH